MIRLLWLLALLAPVWLGLAGCGKYGPNSPPGPPDQVIYGRLPYPAQ